MATCKDCFHYNVCEARANLGDITSYAETCENFVDSSRVIVPPCKVGDTVYQTDGIQIYSSTIKTVIYDTDSIAFDERAIGKTVFLAREDAEAALKERGCRQ